MRVVDTSGQQWDVTPGKYGTQDLEVEADNVFIGTIDKKFTPFSSGPVRANPGDTLKVST